MKPSKPIKPSGRQRRALKEQLAAATGLARALSVLEISRRTLDGSVVNQTLVASDPAFKRARLMPTGLVSKMGWFEPVSDNDIQPQPELEALKRLLLPAS